jgi:hypothetical protein
VPDVKYLHPISENAVENFIWIANERRDAHARSLCHWRGGLGMLRYVCDDTSNSQFDGESHVIAERTAVGSNLAKIG